MQEGVNLRNNTSLILRSFTGESKDKVSNILKRVDEIKVEVLKKVEEIMASREYRPTVLRQNIAELLANSQYLSDMENLFDELEGVSVHFDSDDQKLELMIASFSVVNLHAAGIYSKIMFALKDIDENVDDISSREGIVSILATREKARILLDEQGSSDVKCSNEFDKNSKLISDIMATLGNTAQAEYIRGLDSDVLRSLCDGDAELSEFGNSITEEELRRELKVRNYIFVYQTFAVNLANGTESFDKYWERFKSVDVVPNNDNSNTYH